MASKNRKAMFIAILAGLLLLKQRSKSRHILQDANFVQPVLHSLKNSMLAHNGPVNPLRLCKFGRQIMKDSDTMAPTAPLRQAPGICRCTVKEMEDSDISRLLICIKVAAGFTV